MQVPLKKISYKLILNWFTTNWTNNYVQFTQLPFCSCWETQEKSKKNGSCWLKNSFYSIIIYVLYMLYVCCSKKNKKCSIRNYDVTALTLQLKVLSWQGYSEEIIYGSSVYFEIFCSNYYQFLGNCKQIVKFKYVFFFCKTVLPSFKLLHGVNHEEHQKIIIVCP